MTSSQNPNNFLSSLFLDVSGETVFESKLWLLSQKSKRVFKVDIVFFSFSAGGYCSQPRGNQRRRVQILPMPRQVPVSHCISGNPPLRAEPAAVSARQIAVCLESRVTLWQALRVTREPGECSDLLPSLTKAAPGQRNMLCGLLLRDGGGLGIFLGKSAQPPDPLRCVHPESHE